MRRPWPVAAGRSSWVMSRVSSSRVKWPCVAGGLESGDAAGEVDGAVADAVVDVAGGGVPQMHMADPVTEQVDELLRVGTGGDDVAEIHHHPDRGAGQLVGELLRPLQGVAQPEEVQRFDPQLQVPAWRPARGARSVRSATRCDVGVSGRRSGRGCSAPFGSTSALASDRRGQVQQPVQVFVTAPPAARCRGRRSGHRYHRSPTAPAARMRVTSPATRCTAARSST